MMNRRRFLIKFLGGCIFLCPPIFSWVTGCSPVLNFFLSSTHKQNWLLFNSIVDHLLPSDAKTPGAKTLRAQYYFEKLLLLKEYDSKTLKNGLEHIKQLAYPKNFSTLSSSQKEKILRQFEQSPEGRHWLQTTLEFLLEGLLSSPSYGGNRDRVGWKWLDHRGGQPQPPKGKRYFELRM